MDFDGQILSKSEVFQKYWMKLNLEQHRLPNGEQFEFIVVEAPSWTLSVPVLDNGEFIVIKQYRPAWKGISIEFPGGRIEPNEDIQAGARRELLEETGYEASSMKVLQTSRPITWTTQKMTILVASDLTFHGQQLDEEEEIEVITVSPTKVQHWIDTGKIQHSQSILAYYLYQLDNKT